MERLEMLSSARGNIVIGKAPSDQDANVSDAYDTPRKKTGPPEQASPKVRYDLLGQ